MGLKDMQLFSLMKLGSDFGKVNSLAITVITEEASRLQRNGVIATLKKKTFVVE